MQLMLFVWSLSILDNQQSIHETGKSYISTAVDNATQPLLSSCQP